MNLKFCKWTIEKSFEGSIAIRDSTHEVGLERPWPACDSLCASLVFGGLWLLPCRVRAMYVTFDPSMDVEGWKW